MKITNSKIFFYKSLKLIYLFKLFYVYQLLSTNNFSKTKLKSVTIKYFSF